MISAALLQTVLGSAACLLTAILIAWAWTHAAGRKTFSERLHVSEGRARSSENRATLLKDQLTLAQSDLALLREKMEKERIAKAAEVTELRQTFYRSGLIMAGYALGIGIFFGGTVSWICTNARAETRYFQRLMGLEVETRLAQAQKSALDGELAAWKEEIKDLRMDLRTAMEDKAVALAKLDLVIGSFNPDKLARGFSVDQKKLIEDWMRHEAPEPPLAMTTLPVSH